MLCSGDQTEVSQDAWKGKKLLRLDQKGEGKVTHAIRIDGVDARSRVGKVGLGDVVR